MHAILAYAQLRLVETLELGAMDVIAGLIAKAAEGGALRQLR